ncbi:MAG: prepilin-type N-terminal cleavage/methylation domain-containing protein [Deltaproteobacteria bacterium]|nr:prepilin-type N-terminal cleavage/methylation domain-containing protein [Deltaproteobacteria bacterium]
MKRFEASAGFTLLELMISLTIIAVIAVMVQNGFRLSVGAWEKGESAIEDQQRYRYTLDLIQQQVSSALPRPPSEKTGTDPDADLKGDEASLEFSSRMTLIPGDPSGVVQVKYRVETLEEGKSLWFTERGLVDQLRTSSQDEPGEEDWHILLSDIQDFAFEYHPPIPPEDVLNELSYWQPSWGEQEGEKGLPLALQVRFQMNEGASPLHLVIPVGKGKI